MFNIDIIDKKTEKELLLSDEPKTLIFTRPPSNKLCNDLNRNILSKRSDHVISLWGNVDIINWTGLSFLKLLSNLKRLRIQINILSGSDLSHLNYINELIELYIGETYSDLSMMPLVKFNNTLQALFIDGEKRDLHIMSDMHNLLLLSLRNTSILNLNILRHLRNLKYLITDLNGYNSDLLKSDIDSIEYLELNGNGSKWTIQGEFNFPNLKHLVFVNYKRLIMPPNANFEDLGRLVFVNCNKIEGIEKVKLPKIEEIALYRNSSISNEQIKNILSKYNVNVFYMDNVNEFVNRLILFYADRGRTINQQNFISPEYAKLSNLDWHVRK